jgi:hypothetical protein
MRLARLAPLAGSHFSFSLLVALNFAKWLSGF